MFFSQFQNGWLYHPIAMARHTLWVWGLSVGGFREEEGEEKQLFENRRGKNCLQVSFVQVSPGICPKGTPASLGGRERPMGGRAAHWVSEGRCVADFGKRLSTTEQALQARPWGGWGGTVPGTRAAQGSSAPAALIVATRKLKGPLAIRVLHVREH